MTEAPVSRDALNIALAVVTVLLLAVGGPYLAQRLSRPLAVAGTLPVAQVGQKRVTLEVSGMFCANCASRVTRELEATRGVVACAVDVRAHRATVVCDRQLADTSLVGAVARAGSEFAASIAGH
jgi:copper chaperone CopZ